MSDEKNKYITAYGSSNTDSYGRGDVTDVSTKYSMLTTNPLSDENAPEMNSYSSDGSYNQDIFGWKCFNSPVSFRNGIYGECGSLTTYRDTDVSVHYGIVLSTYSYTDRYGNNKLCSISMCTCGDDPTISEIIIHADNIKLDGNPDFTANKAKKLVDNDTDLLVAYKADQYGTPNHVAINGNLSPRTTGLNLNVGSSGNPFGSVYADNIIARMPLFKMSSSFELYDIRPVHAKLRINFNTVPNVPVPVDISPDDVFYVESDNSIREFGSISVSMPAINSIYIKDNESSYFMIPHLTSNAISLNDSSSPVSLTTKKFICVSSDSHYGVPTPYDSAGSYLDLDFYILIMRIE